MWWKQIVFGCLILIYAADATANIVTWTLNDVTFDDGGTAIGTFDFDADIGIVSAWNISVSGGGRGRADAREGLPYNICLRLRRNWE